MIPPPPSCRITAATTVKAKTYAEAIEVFGKYMDALKDGNWKLVSAEATLPIEYDGMKSAWYWEMKGEWNVGRSRRDCE